MENFIYLNGKFIKESSAKISVFDAGIFYGWALFETVRAYNGKVFRLEQHLDRLFKSSRILKINIKYTPLEISSSQKKKAKFLTGYTKKHIEKAINTLIKKNRIKNGYVRITITRGKIEGQLNLKQRQAPNLFIVAKKLKPFAKKAITTQIASFRRNENSLISKIKSANHLENILAKMDAKKNGFDEAIMLNLKGYVAEGATSNIFLVKNGYLLTPSLDSGILPGITRQVIIEIAKKEGIRVKEKKIKLNELLSAHEVFLTNSISEILPVIKINTKKIGTGKIGSLTKKLTCLYRHEV